MNQLLLDLPLGRKRDLLLARQRARQIVGLLGFDREKQASISATVFEIASQVCGKKGANLRFQLGGNGLQVLALPRSALRLDIPLPPASAKMERADLAWAVVALHENTPLDVLEEVRLQNQELLRTMQELQRLRTELKCLHGLGLQVAA